MKKLIYMPNAITSVRAVVASVAFVYILNRHLTAGFWLFLLAISTDFLDGLAAKKLKAESKFGQEFDGYVDTLTVLLGVLGLSIGGYYPQWSAIVVISLGVIFGILHIVNSPAWKPRQIFEVLGLFAAWIGIVWSYAYLAFGWSWLYILLTFAVLAILGMLKRHRISFWITHKSGRP